MSKPHYIREWRKAAGLTQKQLADAMGRASSYITMVERGTRRYDQPFLEAAAVVLKCTPADLIARPPGQAGGFEALLASASDEERARIEAVVLAMMRPGAGS